MTKYSENEIRELVSRYERLEPMVDRRLKEITAARPDLLHHITSRIKTSESIRGKLDRKSDKYQSIYDIRDILGFRVICYFENEVDEIARLIEDAFVVDRSRSKDKRELLAPTAFGYLSLHYICALPESPDDPGELCGLWFEIQIRTMLQHTWAEIEHDMGYKTEFGIPRSIRRSFSRAAGLLETADRIFSEIRRDVASYKEDVNRRIENDTADELFLDCVSLKAFTLKSRIYRKLLDDIAGITGANITEVDPENQIPQLFFFDIHTLGDLVAVIEEEREKTLLLAARRLRDSGLEELSSTVVFYYLYQALLVDRNCSTERIREFYALTTKNEATIEKYTDRIVALK